MKLSIPLTKPEIKVSKPFEHSGKSDKMIYMDRNLVLKDIILYTETSIIVTQIQNPLIMGFYL